MTENIEILRSDSRRNSHHSCFPNVLSLKEKPDRAPMKVPGTISNGFSGFKLVDLRTQITITMDSIYIAFDFPWKLKVLFTCDRLFTDSTVTHWWW